VIKHFVIFGMSVALVTGSIALAATESPGDYEKSGAPEAHAPEATRAPISETNGQAPKVPLDPGNGNWDPPPVTAPTTQH
jgi:hypothetical protein